MSKQNQAKINRAARSYSPDLSGASQSINQGARIIGNQAKINQLKTAPYDTHAMREANKSITAAIDQATWESKLGVSATGDRIESIFGTIEKEVGLSSEDVMNAINELEKFNVGEDKSGALSATKDIQLRKARRKYDNLKKKETFKTDVQDSINKLQALKNKDVEGQNFVFSKSDEEYNQTKLSEIFQKLEDGIDLDYFKKGSRLDNQAKELSKYMKLRDALQDWDSVSQKVDDVFDMPAGMNVIELPDDEKIKLPDGTVIAGTVGDAVQEVLRLIEAGDIDKASGYYDVASRARRANMNKIDAKMKSEAKSEATAALNKWKREEKAFNQNIKGDINDLNILIKNSKLLSSVGGGEGRAEGLLATTTDGMVDFNSTQEQVASRILTMIAKHGDDDTWLNDHPLIGEVDKWYKKGANKKESLDILDKMFDDEEFYPDMERPQGGERTVRPPSFIDWETTWGPIEGWSLKSGSDEREMDNHFVRLMELYGKLKDRNPVLDSINKMQLDGEITSDEEADWLKSWSKDSTNTEK